MLLMRAPFLLSRVQLVPPAPPASPVLLVLR